MTEARLVPPIGTLFDHDGREYVVKGYLRVSTPPPSDIADWRSMDDALAHILFTSQQTFGPDQVRLEFCERRDAEYVSGSGVAGVILRVADVVPAGHVDWSPERLADEKRLSRLLVGRPIA